MNAVAPIQQAFDLRLPAGRPLVPIEAVMVLADRDEDDVLNLIERGLLRFAWNIASPGAERREIRILRDSVLEYLRGDYARLTSPDARTSEQIAAALLPKPSVIKIGSRKHESIRGVEVARRFSCSQWLIGNLIETKEFVLCPVQIGPKTSPFITHQSVVDFLIRREISHKPNT